MAEKMSVVMARRHIRMAHVVLLVLDSTEGVVGSIPPSPDMPTRAAAH